MPDMNAYEASTLDEAALTRIAKDVSFSLPANQLVDGNFVIDTRTLRRSCRSGDGDSLRCEYVETSTYGLKLGGELVLNVRVREERHHRDRSPEETIDHPVTTRPLGEEDILLFDFSKQYRKWQDAENEYEGDQGCGDELIYPTKGAGLAALLVKMKEDVEAEDRRIHEEAMARIEQRLRS